MTSGSSTIAKKPSDLSTLRWKCFFRIIHHCHSAVWINNEVYFKMKFVSCWRFRFSWWSTSWLNRRRPVASWVWAQRWSKRIYIKSASSLQVWRVVKTSINCWGAWDAFLSSHVNLHIYKYTIFVPFSTLPNDLWLQIEIGTPSKKSPVLN